VDGGAASIDKEVLRPAGPPGPGQDESGYLVVSKRAAGDLSPVTAATFKYLVAVGAACVKAASRLSALSDSDNIGT
jgi:hypothetical protein